MDELNKDEEIVNLLIKGTINLKKMILNKKSHIKKHNKIRNLHNSILESMDNYIDSGKYNINDYFHIVLNDEKEVKDLKLLILQ